MRFHRGEIAPQNVPLADVIFRGSRTACRNEGNGHPYPQLLEAQMSNWLGHDPDYLIPRLKELAVDLEKLAKGKMPSSTKSAVDLEQWSLTTRSMQCLTGVMVSHPLIPDFSPGVTSQIYYIDEPNLLVRTFSRWYRLGTPKS